MNRGRCGGATFAQAKRARRTQNSQKELRQDPLAPYLSACMVLFRHVEMDSR